MSTQQQYDYVRATYFANQEDFRSGEFMQQIEASGDIVTQLVNVYDSTVSGNIEITFAAALPPAEKTALDTLVATFTLEEKNEYFDTVVDANGLGNVQSVAEAFERGATSVYVRDGLYIETRNIVVPDGGQLVGESQSNVKIVCVAGNSVVVDGSGGVKTSVGTISIGNMSSTVTGVGTQFTAAAVGQFILLGTNFHEIATIASDTSLTILEVYQGKSLSTMKYVAQPMITGIKVSNIVVVNSASTGIFYRAVRHSSLEGVAILHCTPNLILQDCGDMSMTKVIGSSSVGVGVTLDNAVSVLVDTLDVYNSSSHGLELKNASSSNVFDACSASNNGGDGIMIGDGTDDLTITSCVAKHNKGHGLHISTTGSNVVATGCTVVGNGDAGVLFEGINGILSDTNVRNNEGNGIACGAGTVLSSNQVNDNVGVGVLIPNGSDRCSVSNCRVTGNTGDGIQIDASNCSVSGSIVCVNALHGIALETNARDTLVTGNQIISNTLGTVDVSLAAVLSTIQANNIKQ